MDRKNLKAWSVAGACTIIMTFIYGIVNNSTGVFLTYVTESLGLSRGAFSSLYTIIGLALMLMSPFVGKVAKKIGLKKTILLGCIMASIGYIGYSFSTKLFQFYAFSVIIGVGGAMCTSVPLQGVINSWFVEKKGIVLGVMLSGISIGGIICTSVSNTLIINYGWSKAYLIVGIFMLVVSIPTVLFLITATPAEKGLKPYGYKEGKESSNQKVEKQGLTFKEAKKTKLFWIAMASIAFLGLPSGVHQHIIPYIVDTGYSQTIAVSSMSVILGMGIFAKIVGGIVFDKSGLKKGFLFLAIPQVVCMLLLFFIREQVALFSFVVLWGFASSLAGLILPIIISNCFGNKDFITIRGIAAMFSGITGSIAPVIAGRIYDISGSYTPAWQLFTVTSTTMVFLVLYCIKLSAKKTNSSTSDKVAL